MITLRLAIPASPLLSEARLEAQKPETFSLPLHPANELMALSQNQVFQVQFFAPQRLGSLHLLYDVMAQSFPWFL